MYPDNQVYKYIDQLEKRVLEQEQLIALLNEKILSLKSTPQVNQPNAADVRSPTSCNVPPRDQNMDQMSFVGTRKSDVPSVTTTKYNQYFVSRVGPDTSAEVLSNDLIANVPALTSVKCCKMKSRHPSYASFHVVIPSDQNELVETEDAWPEGSFVKKFSGRLLDSYILETFESKDADTTRHTAPSPSCEGLMTTIQYSSVISEVILLKRSIRSCLNKLNSSTDVIHFNYSSEAT
ncbi:hypothetical protein M8J76_013908 [Diaphorina citri]|nr:hypothetical protein M8J76_013908 [Diaphorina citri]